MGNLVPGQIKSFSLYINPNKNFHGSYIPLYLTVKIKNQEGGIKKMSIRLPLNKKTETTTISEYDPNHPNNITDVNGTQVKGIGNATISKTLRPDAIGIVIGIEDYQDLPKATYALNDADIVSTYFKNTLGVSNVLTYKNERANWIFFDNMFNLETGELKKMIKPGVTDIFVYFSGHGIPSPSGEQIYMMPSDGKKDRLTSQGINVIALYDNLQHLKARNVFVFIDACLFRHFKTK